MELRVRVDGTQRVVCGVKLTTTCQEIVFALAHATQQAGRFIMIERWRNNERLLSPNEQPLVTLQRWGSRMNEVEYILRKTSTDSPANQPQPLPAPTTIQRQPLPPQTQQSHLAQQPNQLQLQPQLPLQYHHSQPQLQSTPPQQQLQPQHSQPQIQQLPPQPAQMNYYRPSHSPQMNNIVYQNNIRPRNPPGYLDYIKAMAHRNSLVNLAPGSPQNLQIHNNHNNINHNNINNLNHNNLNNLNHTNNNYTNSNYTNNNHTNNNHTNNNHTNNNHTNNNLTNNNLTNDNHTNNHQQLQLQLQPQTQKQSTNQQQHSTSLSNKAYLDILEKIEEQKKVLINQKNELQKLDNEEEEEDEEEDCDKIPPEHVELINRIKDEIQQLEELWKENQVQIKKLEDQDYEKELQTLKSEQTRMEAEIIEQKDKLSRYDLDIALCKNKMEQLEEDLRKINHNNNNGNKFLKRLTILYD